MRLGSQVVDVSKSQLTVHQAQLHNLNNIPNFKYKTPSPLQKDVQQYYNKNNLRKTKKREESIINVYNEKNKQQ